MATAISATDAVRQFSELLNNIRYRGESYTVIRGGKPAASLVPVETARLERTLGELRGIFSTLPHLDPADSAFMEDVLSAVASQPSLPEKSVWE